ncbi:DUF2690 domain-containing protein [Microbacterium ulmi]|uniref:DUF2690 domain-containing protein n=1 Tax=Microbacterium ulmi TaxID=179095 RepID=A0A7Y2Q2A0_9MICO|nr:DUF2690 domain-containing protein [Microbacterium ulmi]NII68640.1 transcriptional regulator with XRE-family HTH domain [Microbacterium ulmi]NNH04810.1 DUF2690 domain-containing protein [Microbacterium ulmi]
MSNDVSASVLAEDGPAHDTVERLAADLRKLRLEADSPTLSKLQSDTGISRTVLSEAFAGKQLPSARTIDSIARACGSDPHDWIDRRDALARARASSSAPAGEQPAAHPAAHPAEQRRAGVSRRAVAWLVGGAFAAGVAASAVVTLVLVPMLVPGAPAAHRAEPAITVASGEDPAQTPCVDDARVATADTRADDSLLEIVWSDACQAGWGRVTRYDGLYAGNTVTIAIYPEPAPDGPDRQEATEHDVQGAYTTLVVRPTPDTLLCAEGSVTVDGDRIDLGDPLCI